MPNTTRDSVINTTIAALLEKKINFALKYDPASRKKIAKLSGTILSLVCTSPRITLNIRPVDEELHIFAVHNTDENSTQDTDKGNDEVDLQIRGSLIALLSLLFNEKHSLAESGITILGKTNLLIAYQAIFKQVDIDWEEPLNELVGVVPGHHIAEALRFAVNWGKTSTINTTEHLSEYLTEEIRVVPSKAEFEKFYQDIDELRAGADRLEAKILATLAQFSTIQK